MVEPAQSTKIREGTEPDSLWIDQIAAGDRHAFEELYQAYAKRLFRYLVSLLGDSSKAEELVNDTMVAVWKAASQFRSQSKVSTWVFAIAHNKALNEMRRKHPVVLDIEDAAEVADPDEGPEGAVRRGDVAERVRSALQQLSPEHRAVVQLSFYEGFSYQEIAQLVQSPISTVKTRMFYARKKLQELLGKEAIIGEAP